MNAIYVRVSTEDQARTGYSLDDQKESCRNRLLSMGLTDIVEYIDDGYSGEYLERPALDRLRDDLKEKSVNLVVLYDPDRLSRNLTNQLILADEIEKAGAKLLFITGDYDASPEGRLFFSMKGAVSAYEKAKIRERTTRGKRAKANKGKIVFNAHPFGYGWNKESSLYIIDEREAEIIRLIYDMCLSQGWGSRAIALELRQRGIIGRKNRPLSICTVSRILTKKMYYGEHYQFKQTTRKTGQNTREINNNPLELWVPITIPAIITREIWEQVQVQLKRNKNLAKRNTKRDYLLRGILHCALCGRSMIAYARPCKRKNGTEKIYYYYSCITKESNSYAVSGHPCQCRRIPVEEIEKVIWQTLQDIVNGEPALSDYFCQQEVPDYSIEIVTLSRLQAELKQKQTDITHWYRKNLLDSKTAEQELYTINRELAITTSTLSDINISQAKIKQLALSPADILSAKSFDEKRDLFLHFPYEIQAVRQGENFEFWFKE